MGLGLSITRRSVQAIGGELRVCDVPGIGCVFTIDLPRLVRTSFLIDAPGVVAPADSLRTTSVRAE